MLEAAAHKSLDCDLELVSDTPDMPLATRCKAIVRGLSAIVTTGVTSTWNEFNLGLVSEINVHSKETVALTSSDRNASITGKRRVLTHHVMVARGRNVSRFAPEPTDWTINELIDWLQNLPANDVDKLPEPDLSIPSISALNKALVTKFGEKVELYPGYRYVASHNTKDDLIVLKMPGFGTGRFCNANDVLTHAL